MSKSGKSTTLAITFNFLHSCQNPVANMAANYICIKQKKSLWKEEMSYGGNAWYMGRIFEELKNYAFVWLICICIIRPSNELF